MSHAIAVVGVAILREGTDGLELLAGRRVEPPELAGGWELPGGKVDPGETHEEAAHREIEEELGVSIVLGERIDGPIDGAWQLSPRHHMQVFTAWLGEGETPQALGPHDALQWVRLQDWQSIDWLEGDRLPVLATVERLTAGD